jgi:hypothetical protein
LAWGLNSPRGLAADADGTVYVSEAGTGGDECVDPAAGPCFGFDGAIQRYTNLGTSDPTRVTVASGLISMAFLRADGPEVLGIAGLDLTDDGELLGTMLFSKAGIRSKLNAVDPPHVPSAPLDAAVEQYAGRVVALDDVGALRVITDVGSVNYSWAEQNKDQSWAPDGQFPDSNPYAVLAEGGRTWVADAGANAVSELVSEGGKIVPKLISYVPAPAPGTSSVPTCIAKSGNWLYVGTLDFVGNFGGTEPVSKVYRINVDATDPFTSAEVWAEGFDPITGCAVIDGALYVTEYMTKATNYEFGAVVRIGISKNGSAGSRQLLGTDLVKPAGIVAVGKSILVANYSVSPAGKSPDEPGGQIVRLIL